MHAQNHLWFTWLQVQVNKEDLGFNLPEIEELAQEMLENGMM